MPISAVRALTEKASTPAIPTIAMIMASVPNDAMKSALSRRGATVASRTVMEFVDDDLANWYVRLNRSRFYDTESPDNRAAFATLHEVLVSVCRLLAPICPFVTDWIHRELTGESVHLAPFRAGFGAPRS